MSSSKAIRNQLVTSPEFALRIIVSAIRGTLFTLQVPGVLCNVIGEPVTWSTLKKCLNQAARANQTVSGESVSQHQRHQQYNGAFSLISLTISYEYDDHYFLTDPKEFIYEFFPLQSEWQLLKTTITLKEFEDLPFVRSLFFRYGLYFPDENTKAVMVTDSTGIT